MQDSQRKSQLIIIFLTVFLYLLGFGLVIPLLPMLSQNFGATAFETGLLLSAYSLMQFIFAPVWGRLSDRYGRRPILLFCLLGEGLSYLLFAAARDLQTLFIARLLAGFFGASLSTASAYISDITPPHERSKGMALIGAAFGLGFVFGPALGGVLAIWGRHISPEPYFDTSFAMWWVAAICFGNFLFGIKFLKESLAESARSKERRNRWSLLREKLSKPTVGALMGVFFLASLAMSSMEASLVLYMGDKFGWGIREVSFGFAYVGVIIILTQGFIVRRMLPKLGERQVLRWGLGLFGLGLLAIGVADSLTVMAIAMTSLAIGNGLTNPSTLGSISLLTPVDEQGVTMGVTQSLASLGRILGPALGGWLFGHLEISAPFFTSAVLAAVALGMVLMLGARVPHSAMKREAQS